MYRKKLVFKDEYFKDEYREGFLVPSIMKSAWAAQLEVLVEIIRICNKYSIKYYADWGTLLGTIRHKGFIPWDDDIDIAMKRKDFNKFLVVAKKELPEKWDLLSFKYNVEYKNGIIRIVNDKEISIENERLENFHGCPFVVGVDIFPLDYIPKDMEQEELQKSALAVVSGIIPVIDNESDKYEYEIEETLRVIEQECSISIDRNGNILNQLYNLCDQLCSLYAEDESEEIACFYTASKAYIGEKDRMKKEWYDETIQMPFENIMITVPKEYDKILKEYYGDYMVPIKTEQFEGTHDYPFYKEQEKKLNEYIK